MRSPSHLILTLCARGFPRPAPELPTLWRGDPPAHSLLPAQSANRRRAHPRLRGENGPAKPEWLDTKPYTTPRDQWVKVRWEMIGGEVRVRIGDITLQGHRDAIALPKTTVAFPVTGGAAQVRGLKIWEAIRAK